MFLWIVLAVVAAIFAVVVYDVVQRRHAVVRNFPIIGHLRYILEAFGPELRQYIVTSNDEERPFSRDQRRWVYATAKGQNSLFGFGTDNDLDRTQGYLIVKHSVFPLPTPGAAEAQAGYTVPCAKVLGAAHNRSRAFRPTSVVNISALSFGALSGRAIEALNSGAATADCLHNTGEGGVSRHHDHGGELIWQIGTGYFGCRDAAGHFDLDAVVDIARRFPVRAIEIKLSQGAKAGIGGLLPAAKVTREIAEIRGVVAGQDCVSPPAHAEFADVDGLLTFVERIADATGLPVGIKAAVGDALFWNKLAERMAATDLGVDFVTVDGGEGGTGAAPLVFADHVALPFKLAMAEVYRAFALRRLTDRVVFVGSGKLGFPETALLAFALGCDLVNIGREAMLAIGCLQSQRCHTGRCPTGVATQSRWRARGLDPTLKAQRLAAYVIGLRGELLRLSRACGLEHPALVSGANLERLQAGSRRERIDEVYGYKPGWGLPCVSDREDIRRIMAGTRQDNSS